MITSFADRDTERLFQRHSVRRFPAELHRVMVRKLVKVDAVTTLDELRVPPDNRLEKLKGARAGQYSIRVNDQCASVSAGRMGRLRTSPSWTIITEDRTMATKLTPIHPGEVLLVDFLEAFGLSQYRLARDISVAPRRINEIVHGTRAITADTALRLGRYFGMSPQFWLNLQSRYDLEVEQDRLGARLRSEVSVYARAS